MSYYKRVQSETKTRTRVQKLNLKPPPSPAPTLLMALMPSPSSLVRFMSEPFSPCTPVLRDYTPLPLITHTFLNATCRVCNPVLVPASHSPAHNLFTQKHVNGCTCLTLGKGYSGVERHAASVWAVVVSVVSPPKF